MKRRTLAFTIAMVAVVLLGSGLLVEVVLRAYAGVADSGLAEALRADPYAVRIQPHGQAGYRPRPGRTVEYDNGTVAHINDMAFRGPAVQVPKPPGVLRIVLLGGSTTFGWGVDDHETIRHHMSEILRTRHGDPVFEVVNLAFDGYDSYQLLERLRSDGVALEPDFVIVNTGVNDVANAWYRELRDGDRRSLLYRATMDRLRSEAERGGPTLWTRAKHWLYAARVPGWLRSEVALAGARSVAVDRPPPEPHWDFLDYFERNLERLVDLGSRSGSAVVLLSTPPSSLLTRYEPTDPPIRHYWVVDAATTQVHRDSLTARMRAVASAKAAEGRPVAYVPHDELPPAYFTDDAHLTSEGNRRVAEDFVAALEPWLTNDREGPAR